MISAAIKNMREHMGLSQAGLAKRLGVTRASVNAWEMEISAPTAQYLIEMARLFHCSTDYLLGLEAQENLSLQGLSEEEKQLLYRMVDYMAKQHE